MYSTKRQWAMPQILCVEQAALAEWRLWCLTCDEEESPDRDQDKYSHWYEEMWEDKEEQRVLRGEMHLIRVRDKHLAALRLHKKDKADAAKEANKPAASCQLESVAATIPVAVQPDPESNETSPIGAQAPETAVKDAAELERWRQIREETAKFIAYLQSRRTGLSPAEISQEIENHLNEIGLPYPPEPQSN